MMTKSELMTKDGKFKKDVALAKILNAGKFNLFHPNKYRENNFDEMTYIFKTSCYAISLAADDEINIRNRKPFNMNQQNMDIPPLFHKKYDDYNNTITLFSADKPAVEKLIDTCLATKGNTPQQTAWNYVKCYHEKDPKHAIFL